MAVAFFFTGLAAFAGTCLACFAAVLAGVALAGAFLACFAAALAGAFLVAAFSPSVCFGADFVLADFVLAVFVPADLVLADRLTVVAAVTAFFARGRLAVARAGAASTAVTPAGVDAATACSGRAAFLDPAFFLADPRLFCGRASVISASTVSSVGTPATWARPGSASSMPRRGGSSACTTKVRVSPRLSTSFALRSNGAPRPVIGT